MKKKHKQMPMDEAIASIEKALREGNALHTFRSGGGLQVARLEKVKGKARRGDMLTGYGEHPHISEALRHAGEDFAAGGRPYSEVYGTFDMDDPKGGKEGIYPMYLTGTYDVESPLDKWCKQNTLDARFENGKIRVDLRGWGEFKTDDKVHQEVRKTGKPIRIEERGFVYECAPDPSWNNAITTRIVSTPPGVKEHRGWMWHTVQTGLADTLTDAIDGAFKAKPEDTNED